MQLLKQPNDKEDRELEIVRKIQEILENPKTREILNSSDLLDEDLISMILPFPALSCKEIGQNIQACKAIADIEHFLTNKRSKDPISIKECENKKYREKLMFRRASLPGYTRSDPFFKLEFKDKLSLEIIEKLSKANDTFNPPLFTQEKTLDSIENESVIVEKIHSPMKYSYSFVSPAKKNSSSMIHKLKHLPFEGSANAMDEGSESEAEIELKKNETSFACPKGIELSIVKEEIKEPILECSQIDIRIHKYQESFDELLCVEKEPNNEKV